jgi:hypothetical protein
MMRPITNLIPGSFLLFLVAWPENMTPAEEMIINYLFP